MLFVEKLNYIHPLPHYYFHINGLMELSNVFIPLYTRQSDFER